MDKETLDAVRDTISFGKDIFDYLKERGILEKFRDSLLRRPEHYILVFGASGVGKTAMIKYLRGQNAFIPPERRSFNHSEHSFELDDFKFRLIDTPGEQVKKEKRIDAIKKVLAKGSASLGVINVVAYGYHEGPQGQYPPLIDGRVNERYLEDCRKQELEQIAEWVPLLFGGQQSASWLMTVMTKADLWWNPQNAEEVKNYYSNLIGKYTKALGSAITYPNTICQISSIHQCFYKKGPMSGYYTDQMKNQDYWNLIGGIFENAATS